jgi:hypothetical protein
MLIPDHQRRHHGDAGQQRIETEGRAAQRASRLGGAGEGQ